MNPSRQHGVDPTIASGGSTVYVAWTSAAYAGLDAHGPRTLHVRVNRNHGFGTWVAARRLTSLIGRVLGAQAAATGSGAANIVRSGDRGRTWSTVTVGTTTRGSPAHRDAGASIAASGRNAVVGWISSVAGTVKARVSVDGGLTWRRATTLQTGADAGTKVATFATSGRVVVAWVDGAVVRHATWRASTGKWTYATLRLGPGYLGVESVAVSPIGFAIVACRDSCDETSASYGADLVWREHDGPYWHAPHVLAGTSDTASAIESPSVVTVGSTSRFVMFSVRREGADSDRLRVRQGIGRP